MDLWTCGCSVLHHFVFSDVSFCSPSHSYEPQYWTCSCLFYSILVFSCPGGVSYAVVHFLASLALLEAGKGKDQTENKQISLRSGTDRGRRLKWEMSLRSRHRRSSPGSRTERERETPTVCLSPEDESMSHSSGRLSLYSPFSSSPPPLPLFFFAL